MSSRLISNIAIIKFESGVAVIIFNLIILFFIKFVAAISLNAVKIILGGTIVEPFRSFVKSR
jgi:hypothetical protein